MGEVMKMLVWCCIPKHRLSERVSIINTDCVVYTLGKSTRKLKETVPTCAHVRVPCTCQSLYVSVVGFPGKKKYTPTHRTVHFTHTAVGKLLSQGGVCLVVQASPV